MLVSLGVEVRPRDLSGGGSLIEVSALNLATADTRLRGVELIVATDVDNPLLGPTGAAAVFGPQKGASPDEVRRLDAALSRWAQIAPRGEDLVDRPGAGAAGGLAFGFYLLGARRESGISLVAKAVGLRRRLDEARIVLTGEGSFDGQSLRGKVVAGVAALAAEANVPCLVLAGQVRVAAVDAAAAGIAAAYAVADVAGSVEEAMARPFDHLCDLAAHVARSMQ
jgi:glycerate kinase